jgi:serine/threonine protein kinase
MVNHKNLMNLVGYCEDEEPFTRMMVFEYVSNGSLFEHLHGEFSYFFKKEKRKLMKKVCVGCCEDGKPCY